MEKNEEHHHVKHLKDFIAGFGVITAFYLIAVNPALANKILANNPSLYYWVLTPWVIGSVGQWFLAVGLKRVFRLR